jgi:hypothetical protein
MDRRPLGHRNRGGLAGDEALVEVLGPALDDLVHRDPLARAHQHAVAGSDVGERHVPDRAVGFDAGRGLAAKGREVLGERPGAPAHRMVEHAPDSRW